MRIIRESITLEQEYQIVRFKQDRIEEEIKFLDGKIEILEQEQELESQRERSQRRDTEEWHRRRNKGSNVAK